ncbi:hypothetical protein D9758_003396 [Tetrapyrgos nigripes]|uniref:Fungal-type protein kinase domain-containing protein n=1 Tax=Tetrapyrgos nigripes TaxID=182062 RepID=A0A8H5GVP1_9AGAR|nr:hypothetical protein D9758_003396 [Tetrapyrgos nigripes]
MKQLVLALAKEMPNKFLGPVPSQTFINTNFPGTAFEDKQVPQFDWNAVKDKFQLKSVDLKKCNERDMYTPLIAAFDSCSTNQFECLDTSSIPDSCVLEHCHTSRPDITGYEKSRRDNGSPSNDSKSKPKSDSSLSDWLAEVKKTEQDLFMDEPSGPYLIPRQTETGDSFLGQQISYVIAQFANQYRTHVFSMYIFGCKAHLLRWDHAGAIVSEAFNYMDTPYLAEFVFRYTRASPEARGHDNTVKRFPLLNRTKPVKTAREQLDLKNNEPVYKFNVYDDDDPKNLRIYYGGNPLYNGVHSITGRATRTVKVWDHKAQMIVLLKDQWRIDSPEFMSEGEIYKLLEEKGVRNIPSCVIAGDVNPDSKYHSTLMQRQLGESEPALRSHVHYRLVLEEVGVGNVTKCKDTKEFVTVLRDALTAHKDAFDKAGLLHRDVSIGNIIVMGNGRGLLVDWEFSKPKDQLESQGRQLERTGTWQFISVALLQARVPFHTLQDDLESFLHVTGWTSICHIKNNLTPDKLVSSLRSYDEIEPEGGTILGGRQKEMCMIYAALSRMEFEPPIIHSLISDFEATCASRYLPVPEQANVAKLLAILDTIPEESLREQFKWEMPALRYHFGQKRLEDATWMIERCDEALKSMQSPTDICAFVENEFPRVKSKRKAGTSLSDLETKTRSTRANDLLKRTRMTASDE